MSWILPLLSFALVALEATYEGLKLRGRHIASEFVELSFLSLVIPMSLLFAAGTQFPLETNPASTLKVLGGYLLLRIGIFDLIHNLSAGLHPNYIGNTKSFDKWFKKIIEKFKIHFSLVWFTRAILVFISLAWLFNYKQ